MSAFPLGGAHAFMQFLNDLIGMVDSIARILLTTPVGLCFLGLGIFGAVVYFVRRLC